MTGELGLLFPCILLVTWSSLLYSLCYALDLCYGVWMLWKALTSASITDVVPELKLLYNPDKSALHCTILGTLKLYLFKGGGKRTFPGSRRPGSKSELCRWLAVSNWAIPFLTYPFCTMTGFKQDALQVSSSSSVPGFTSEGWLRSCNNTVVLKVWPIVPRILLYPFQAVYL